MHLDIQNDAIFIADAHYNKNRKTFEEFLDKLISKEIKTSQIFFMGDMFDYLSDQISYFKNCNQTIINKINTLSQIIQIIYIEGNHDYNLTNIFPNLIIVPRKEQPIIANYQNNTVAISHGDIFTPLGYNIYTFFIRNKILLSIINMLDVNHIITKKIESGLISKTICHQFNRFDIFAEQRINNYKPYDIDMIIEGHFHQGKQYKNYINIPAFACDKRYFHIQKGFI